MSLQRAAREAGFRHERLETGEIALHVVRAGEGPPVILLHGFPEFWYSWRDQIEALADAGFSVLAPDMRGYHLSDKPGEQAAYDLHHLVRDVAALVAATGHARAHIVGHDWGGVVAWAFAAARPELVDRLVVVNAPHPAIYSSKVRRWPQMFKSLYVLLFLLPWVPERVLLAYNGWAIRFMLTRAARVPDAFTQEDQDRYVEAIRQPGAMTAALNYYRANVRDGAGIRRVARVDVRALVIWGERDPALGTDLLEGLEELVPRVMIERLAGVGHWVQREAPQAVSRLMIDFLRA